MAEPNNDERIVISPSGGALNYITPSRPSYRDLAARTLTGANTGVSDTSRKTRRSAARTVGRFSSPRNPAVCF
jgi:hypothetical protein